MVYAQTVVYAQNGEFKIDGHRDTQIVRKSKRETVSLGLWWWHVFTHHPQTIEMP